MLPDYKTDWRWRREGHDTPWYPQSMRLFRQTARDDWQAVVAVITHALAEQAAANCALGKKG